MRRKVQLTTAFAVLCILWGPAETKADIRIVEERAGQVAYTVVEIHGLIQPSDVARLETLIQTDAGSGAIVPNSMGGDVTAAMALGRILRRERRTVVMGPDGQASRRRRRPPASLCAASSTMPG